MSQLLVMLPFLVWVLLWVVGGWLIAVSMFRLRRGEAAMIGLGIGLITQIWLANVLAHAVPIVAASWLAGAIVLLAGVTGTVAFRPAGRLHLSPALWVVLGAMTMMFNAIGRGLGVFDDYQNLPTISLMAAGDVPPHFALNPSLRFGYHYLLLLFAAEVMRLGNAFPWSALDLVRGLSLALPLILAALWAYRMTGSRLAAFLTACLMAFAGGTRWLLLLLPPPLLQAISANVTLIGSAATSAPDLASAMISTWKIDGAGPIGFPFAFYSGINQPYIMAHTGIAGTADLILLLILLTAQRWRHWTAGLVTLVLLAALAIANEIAFLLIGLGFLIAAALWVVRTRRLQLSAELLGWAVIVGGALVAALSQGGLLTELGAARLKPSASLTSYFDTSPVFVWPPAMVSAHLGSLSLFNPSQFLCALLEIGPLVLATPLALAWAGKSLRLGRWFEVALMATASGAVLAAFVAFRGPLFTAAPRLLGVWFFYCAVFGVPLLWIWLKWRTDGWRVTAVGAGLMAILGGLVLFGVQLAAIQKPTYATFVTPMDAKMSQEYWDRLQPGSLIFDPVVFRAPTLFGRFTDSSPSWYTRSDSWQALSDAPDPTMIHDAGFDYMYFDSNFWEGLTAEERSRFVLPCVKLVAQVDGVHSEKDYTKDFRRLLDIRSCQ